MSRDNDPATAPARLADAVVAHVRSNLPAARSKSQTTLLAFPADAPAWRELAYASLAAGATAALRLLQRGVAAAPDSPDSWNDIASLALAAGLHSSSLRALRRAVALDPGGPARWRDLSMVVPASDETRLRFLRRTLFIRRDDASTLRIFAEALLAHGEEDRARFFARRALVLSSADVGAFLVLGLVAQRRREWLAADTAFRRAVSVAPLTASAWHNFAVVASSQGESAATDRGVRRALAAEPAFIHSLLLSGNRSIEIGDVAAAARRFRRARATDANFPEAELNLGMISLLDGDYTAGWLGFAARWRCASHHGFKPTPGARIWDGRVDRSARLLIRAEPEQALGDTIQFARFVAAAAARVGELMIECAPTLRELIGKIPGIARLIDVGDAPPPAQWSCGLMDLGGIFAPTLSSLPASSPYIEADPAVIAAWTMQLGSLPRPRIGVCWRGNPRFRMDRQRSPGIGALTPLFRRAAPHLVSLVHDRQADETPPVDIADPMSLVSDMADTAALISALDLVITSDTSIAHLSGALGRPTWVLLHEVPDWRWLRGRNDSPWYPSARLFRQPSPGEWASVIAAVAAALDSLLFSAAGVTPPPSAHR